MHFETIRNKIIKHITIIKNFSYLSIIQVFNMLLPLIVFPYLIRVLGSEKYGLVVFAQAIILYLNIIINFGFNLSATKQVSIYRDDKKKIGEIASTVLILKILLFVVACLIVIGIIFFLPQAKPYKLLYLLSLSMCFYEVIFPLWYFQGIEKMKYITLLNLISRTIFVSLIFLLVKRPDDYLLVPGLNGIGAVLSGLLALYIVFIKDKIRFHPPKLIHLKEHFSEAFPFFISNVSGQIYVKANKIILGLVLGMESVTLYDIAEKVISVLKIPQRLFNQAIYPKISRENNTDIVKTTFKLSLIFNISITLIIIILAKPIVLTLGGNVMFSAVNVLRILAISIPIIGINSVYVMQLMLPFGYERDYMRISLESLFLYILFISLFYYFKYLGIYQITFINVVVELYVNIRTRIVCKKNKLF